MGGMGSGGGLQVGEAVAKPEKLLLYFSNDDLGWKWDGWPLKMPLPASTLAHDAEGKLTLCFRRTVTNQGPVSACMYSTLQTLKCRCMYSTLQTLKCLCMYSTLQTLKC